MTTTFERSGLIHDLDENSYHGDLTTLSSTGARALATRTPAEFRHEQLNGRPDKKEFDFGHLVHKMILGKGADIRVIEADDWRTKAAREKRDAAREAGEVPVLEKEWRRAERVVESFRLHETAAGLISGGAPEVSLYWADSWSGVRCRGRVDYLRPDVAVDVKTTQDADPRKFAKSVAEYGYHAQAAWYMDGLTECGVTVTDFVFVVVSVVAPHLVSVCRLSDAAIDRGRELNRVALERFAVCELTGEWPGHGNEIHTIDLPSWAA
ncbi:hypothetical protein ACN95_14460 [Gordonia sihwensis]|uniref:PD-(D/E)XK nuclease-like domain-containing protein n=1 Tax=Gordonia sihwensis TaxID=173559 RepID=UPI001C92C68A|nr:PD-(D/E)XK nuclease-like domain-containing protein [Gordonia sihwensis]MBY4571219.1 hypothetical protein [Gordonia sihwensis]